VSKRNLDQPNTALRVVNKEPHSAGTGDLVLPLLEVLPVVSFAGKLALELVMAIGVYAPSWVHRKSSMHLSAVPSGNVAQPGPMLGRLLVGEPQIPLRSNGWAGYTIFASAHRGEGTSSSKSSLAWSIFRAATVVGFDHA
jgi:hypothetical protein